MAANLNPVFTLTPVVGAASISVSDGGSRTSPSNAANVVVAGTNGTMIVAVYVKATGTTTAGLVRLWLFNGTTYYLFEEIAVTAVTPSGTVASFSGQSALVTPVTPLCIPSGWTLRASTQNAEGFVVEGFGGDF